ncbi:MAG: hypothetical protein ACI9NT_001155 [Bacteroidia bacterium]|jgi:hypothetical protein
MTLFILSLSTALIAAVLMAAIALKYYDSLLKRRALQPIPIDRERRTNNGLPR